MPPPSNKKIIDFHRGQLFGIFEIFFWKCFFDFSNFSNFFTKKKSSIFYKGGQLFGIFGYNHFFFLFLPPLPHTHTLLCRLWNNTKLQTRITQCVFNSFRLYQRFWKAMIVIFPKNIFLTFCFRFRKSCFAAWNRCFRGSFAKNPNIDRMFFFSDFFSPLKFFLASWSRRFGELQKNPDIDRTFGFLFLKF